MSDPDGGVGFNMGLNSFLFVSVLRFQSFVQFFSFESFSEVDGPDVWFPSSLPPTRHLVPVLRGAGVEGVTFVSLVLFCSVDGRGRFKE